MKKRALCPPSGVHLTIKPEKRSLHTFIGQYHVLMLVHPSSGDNIFYKVRDANHIILIDSFGNEPKKIGKTML